MPRLTERFVASLPLRAKGQKPEWCSHLTGFGVLVGKRRKSYIVRTRTGQKTLGHFGVMPFNDALDMAEERLRADRRGEDPNAGRNAADVLAQRRDALTLRVAFDEMVAARASDTRPSTVRNYHVAIHAYLDDWLDRSLAQITENDVSQRYADIVNRRVDRLRRDGRPLLGGKTSAKKAFEAFRGIYNFAKWNHRDLTLSECPVAVLTNTVRGWSAITPRERILEGNEIAAFVRCARSYPNSTTGNLAQFLLFTGLRLKVSTAEQFWATVAE